ncbi:MAG: c-type cytochrome biogenesis protein CcmI [Rhodospirillales bacterium]
MTSLWIGAGVLTFAVVFLLVAPLVRRRRTAAPRQAYDLAVLVQQLAEVDQDLARGLIGEAEAAAARIELKRRILAAADAPPAEAAAPAPAEPAASAPGAAGPAAATAEAPPAGPGRREGTGAWVTAAIALVVPLLAMGVYLIVGQPDSPDRPLAARLAQGGDLAQDRQMAGEDRDSLAQTVDKLERFLQERPNEAEGWLLLGRARMTLDQPMEAIAALQRAYTIAPQRSDIAGALGEAIVIGAGGEVTDAAQRVLTAALDADPGNIQARYYLALGEAQRGQVREAVQGWVDLVALSPADAPWLPQVEAQIGEAADSIGLDRATLRPSDEVLALARQAPVTAARPAPPAAAGGDAAAGANEGTTTGEGNTTAGAGPSRADMEAAARLSAEERDKMIRSMVARLAERLEAHPEDADGWTRLARAYDVLGEPAKAADARARAEAARRR